MKAKHVFMSLVLPTVLAACTADDFMTEQGNANLSDRPVVGNVEFILPGADTRVGVEGDGYKWTESDKLGAALMDTWSKPDADDIYTISNNLFTNYRYDYVNGSFTNSNAVFVEGNYFIYAPFNADQKREGLAYSINNVQESGEDGTKSLTDNQFFLDHVFVEQGNSAVEVDPIQVFPRIVLNAIYEGSKDVLINKIVIKATDKFGVNGKVTPAETLTAQYDALSGLGATEISGKGFAASDYQVVTTGSNLAKTYDAYKKAVADLNVKYTLPEGKKKGDLVNPNVVDFYTADASAKADNMTLIYSVPAADVKGILVAPVEEEHSESNVTIEIYTNKGLVTIAGAAGNLMSNNFVLDSDVADYPTTSTVTGTGLLDDAQRAIAYTGVKDYIAGVKAGKSQNVTVKFKDDAILVPPTLTVTSTEELKYYLNNWYAGKKGLIAPGAGNVVTVTADPAEGETIELDGEVLAFIQNSANPVIKFVGDVVIPADADASTLNNIVKGTADLNVVNKGVQNWTKAATFTEIVNEGELTVGTGAQDETATYTVTTVENKGTMTVNKAISATIYNDNMLTLNANVGKVRNGSDNSGADKEDGNHTATLTVNKGTVTTLFNYAKVSVPAGKTATITNLSNYYQVAVAGTLTTEGTSKSEKATNGKEGDAVITVAAGASWIVDGTSFTNSGAVENKGTITVMSTFDNNGSVENYGQIACASGAAFNNNKDMHVYAESITLISDNQDAEIVVEQGVTSINVAGTNQGKITFVVSTQEGLESIPDIANSLRITASSIQFAKDFNTGNEYDYVEFMPAGNMTISVAEGGVSFANVEFTAGNSNKTFTLNSNLTASEKLTIDAKSKVIINKTLTFGSTTASNFTNKGEMLIIGTLHFSNIASTSSGDVTLGKYLFAGGSAATNITWQ